MLYLDYNATTPLKIEAQHAIQNLMGLPLNASSIHQYGKTAKKIIKDTKQQLKNVLNIQSEQIVFCSSGSEANNLAIKGANPEYIVVSAIEHLSVLKPARQCKKHFVCPVDENGVVDNISLEKILAEQGQGGLVCIMLANNETGVLQKYDEIAQLCKKYKCLWFADAIQAFGKTNLDFSLLQADIITVSGHKIGASIGVAAVIFNDKKISLEPLIQGGNQENKFRAGTENILAIASFGVVLQKLSENIDFYQNQLKSYRNNFENKIKQIAPDAVIHSQDIGRIPNTSCITMPNVSSAVQLIAFDLAGIAVSTGSACSSGKVESSHVLKAMKVDSKLADCTIRVSTGFDTKKEDLEKLFTAWRDLYKRTR